LTNPNNQPSDTKSTSGWRGGHAFVRGWY